MLNFIPLFVVCVEPNTLLWYLVVSINFITQKPSFEPHLQPSRAQPSAAQELIKVPWGQGKRIAPSEQQKVLIYKEILIPELQKKSLLKDKGKDKKVN